MSGTEDKVRLLGKVRTLKLGLGELQKDLETTVQNAKELNVYSMVIKTDKALDKVNSGLMVLVL